MTVRRSPLLPVILFSIVCAGSTWLVLRLVGHPFSWPYACILAWFATVTLVLHLWQEPAAANNVRGFMRRFMAGLVIKLLASLVLVFVLVQLLTDAALLKPLLLAFVLLYLAFLGFSTARLIMLMKRNG